MNDKTKYSELSEQEREDALLGAVDDGLAVAAGTATPKPMGETEDDDEPAGSELAGQSGTEGADEPGADGEETDDSGDTEVGEGGQAEPTEGEQAGGSKDGDAEPASPSGEGEPASPPADQQTRPSDEFGSLPEGTKQETRERFETLKGRFDDVIAERDAFQQRNTDWMETIRDTGANPEQLGGAFNYLRLINEGTHDSLSQAYDIMARELEVVGKAIGRGAPGEDPLAQHPDLLDRVELGNLEREDAIEIANARVSQRIAEARRQNDTKQEDLSKAQNAAVAEIAQLGAAWKAGDPQYAAKLPVLQEQLTDIIESGADPKTWAPLLKTFYKRIPAPTGRVGTPHNPVPPPKPPVTDSIRPGNSGGAPSLEKKPGSALEAVDVALGL